MLKTLCQDEEGLTTVEYAILLLLIALATIAAWTALGSRLEARVSAIANDWPGS